MAQVAPTEQQALLPGALDTVNTVTKLRDDANHSTPGRPSLLLGGPLALALPRRANAQLLVQRELLPPLLLVRLSYERVRGQAGRIMLRHVVHHLPGGGPQRHRCAYPNPNPTPNAR